MGDRVTKKPRERGNLEAQPPTAYPWAGWMLLGILALTAALRLRLLGVLLERDEGEYAYAGQLLLQGIPPFAQAYNMKMPGIYLVYASIMAVLGQSPQGIHLGLLAANLGTIVLLYFLGKRLCDTTAAIVGSLGFALLALSSSVQGVFANAEHFVLVPALGGILLLLRAVASPKLRFFFLSGLVLGTAFIIKQHGAAFIALGGAYLICLQLSRKSWRGADFIKRLASYGAGALIPFTIICLFMVLAGTFNQFWFWTFTYAWKYVTAVPFTEGLHNFRTNLSGIINTSPLLWILAGIGLLGTFTWNKPARSQALFISLFLVFSFLAICPGLYFRPHYFLLFLPAVALLSGIGFSSIITFLESLARPLRLGGAVLLAAAILFSWAYGQRQYLFQASPARVARMVYGPNPFPESLELARYLRENSAPEDRLAVLGSEPQIYFYARRRSASKYLYTYALMEKQPYALEMQREMIEEIEKQSPKFLIWVNISTSWLVQQGSDKLIFNWFDSIQPQLEKVGVVDIVSPERTVYIWGNEAADYIPTSEYYLIVFKRKR
jgi:hypothetical protein